jgi:hypothetical protein
LGFSIWGGKGGREGLFHFYFILFFWFGLVWFGLVFYLWGSLSFDQVLGFLLLYLNWGGLVGYACKNLPTFVEGPLERKALKTRSLFCNGIYFFPHSCPKEEKKKGIKKGFFVCHFFGDFICLQNE